MMIVGSGSWLWYDLALNWAGGISVAEGVFKAQEESRQGTGRKEAKKIEKERRKEERQTMMTVEFNNKAAR